MYNNLIVENKDQIAYITINRPNQLNALNKDTISELHDALKAADEDNGVGVIILTGSGEKAFVAGADIKEFADFDIKQGNELAAIGQRSCQATLPFREYPSAVQPFEVPWRSFIFVT